MSRESHDDECAGCRPVLLNPATGEVMLEGRPEMVAVLRVWGETTREEREAFHRVTCDNSREAVDLALLRGVTDRMQGALRGVDGSLS